MAILSPNGVLITIRPIQPNELDRVVLRCWPDREAIGCLFAEQDTIGMAAWEGDKCVGELHGYRIALPDMTNKRWPEHNRWWSPDKRARAVECATAHTTGNENGGPFDPIWCHACLHVGRTFETFCAETLWKSVLPTARREKWDSDAGRILMELKERIPGVSESAAAQLIEEALHHPESRRFPNGNDPRYFGRGIGTALCKASADWARDHGYAAVAAMGAPAGFSELASWIGSLPFTAYARLGFVPCPLTPEEENKLPDWAKGASPPEVMAQVQAALAAGRPAAEFHGRLMVLTLG